MPHTYSLSLAAVDMLLERAELPRAVFPFEIQHIGTTKAQRAQVHDAIIRDLQRRELILRGRLDGDVELALRTFARSPVAITAVAKMDGEQRLFARVASDRRFAVLARQEENMLIFTEARPAAVVPAIVDLLPLTRAAAGRPVRHDRSVDQINAQPKLRFGQFISLVEGERGHEAQLDTLAWFDTDGGRYLISTAPADDGRALATYFPGDNARIAQHLYAQLEGYL